MTRYLRPNQPRTPYPSYPEVEMQLPEWRVATLHLHTCVTGLMKEESSHVKPVLNWANVCSPNILRTVRRTMIRFLIELLVAEYGSESPNFTSFSTGL